MTEKRFTIVGEEYVGYMQGNAYIISNGECKFSLWERKEDAQKVCDYLNEQQNIINKQNELIKLIANACTYSKEHSVKEILRKEIKGIDTVTYESANAWHDYVLLSEFFKECYGEHWDNE